MAVTFTCASSCSSTVFSSRQTRKRAVCYGTPQMTAVAAPAGKTRHTLADSKLGTGKVYITRHGERADLADERWVATATTASDDPPLTQQGLQQARELGIRLRGEQIGHIYSSPFTRTAQTAQEVATCLGESVSICIEDGLAEGMLTRLFPAGRPKFRTPEHLKTTCPNVDPSYQSVLQLHFPEDYKDAQARCKQIAHVLADRHPHENILLVAHGLSVEYLATALVTKEKCSLHIPYCCLTECKRDGNGDWTYGLHMDQDFLSRKQEKSDADKQRELWGLDEQTA